MPIWIKDKLFQKANLIKKLKYSLDENISWKDRLLFSEHHLSHAASAFYPSPFNNAAILTLDGVGEWTTSSLAIGNNNQIEIVKELNFSTFTRLLYQHLLTTSALRSTLVRGVTIIPYDNLNTLI